MANMLFKVSASLTFADIEAVSVEAMSVAQRRKLEKWQWLQESEIFCNQAGRHKHSKNKKETKKKKKKKKKTNWYCAPTV